MPREGVELCLGLNLMPLAELDAQNTLGKA